jgi:hypothetical protein
MGLKVTLTSGKVLSVVPVSGQAPEEALEQTLKRQGFPPPVEKVEVQYYDPTRKERFFYRPWEDALPGPHPPEVTPP